MTLDGTSRMTCRRLDMGTSAGPDNVFTFNLNGGTLTMGASHFVSWGAYTGIGYLNFNGGTFEGANVSGFYVAPKTAIVVYPKGGTIYCPANGVKFSSPLRAAQGWGVERIALTNPGAGYLVPPCVFIEGGSGSNATAIAVMKKDMTIEKIVVTCPGEGYLPTDTVTVRFENAGTDTGAGAAATVKLAKNTKPILHKTGPGTLTINADSPFDGFIDVVSGDVVVADGVSAPNLRWGLAVDHAVRSLGAAQYSSYYNDSGVIIANNDKLNAGEIVFDSPNCADYTDTPSVWGVINSYVNRIVRRDPETGALGIASRGTLSAAVTADTDATIVDADPNPLEYNGTVNGFYMSPGKSCYLKSSSANGENVVRSGMIFDDTKISSGNIRLATATVDGRQQTMTTYHPFGMMIYSYNEKERGIGSAGGNRRLMFNTCFADPANGNPMRLTLAGSDRGMNNGAWVFLTGKNTFSGGLHLLNTLLCCNNGNDDTFGAAGGEIVSAGWSGINANGANVDIAADRTITVKSGHFNLQTASGKSITVNADITGPGHVVIGRLFGEDTESVVYLRGDNNGLTGTLYVGAWVSGDEGVGIPSSANLAFCGPSGCWRTHGDVTRAADFTPPVAI